ncbi:metallophosphoesterase [Nakamurella sp. A5-74]|uniref:Metallophosphoesterase n=1 Tax=Nakamurella sp. A5-74 TaxID=3158264 RepID=A0AAU8DIS3_9ACTN
MKSGRIVMVALAAELLLASLGGVAAASPIAPSSGDHTKGGHPDPAFTFAVIGDIPYGATQIREFPERIAQINADRQVQLVDHLGDIKNGSSTCDDAYYGKVRSEFDTFRNPLVYTPGDNEWTDCHRTNNGAYNPLERLAAVRQDFFPRPGRTLGQHPIRVTSQVAHGYPENVSYQRGDVAFAAVHLVGSNNSLAPWTGLGLTAPTPEQSAEVLGRTAADIQLIRDTFAAARRDHNRAVVLLTQADMFDATVPAPTYADYFAFTPVVAAIAQESRNFRGPVYLFNGDSHVFRQDTPLAAGSKWLPFYQLTTPVSNLHRVTIEGSTDADEWLKVTIDKHNPAVLTWQRILYS